MYDGCSVFHESYYEHSCVVFSEKDVLYTDITGNDWWSAVKRWWYNLFLLSFHDERCRSYYTSSQAMRLDRTRQFRHYRNRIHPLSKFSNFWNYFISIVIIARVIMFRYTTSLTLGGQFSIYIYILADIFELFIILDICVSFKTGYIDPEARRIIVSAGKSHLQFAVSKMFIHVAGAMPLSSIMFLRYGLSSNCGLCKANSFVATLRILSTIGWYRLFDSTEHWTKQRASFKVMHFFVMFRICVLGMVTMFMFQTVCDAIYTLVIIHTKRIPESSFFRSLLQMRYWTKEPLDSVTLIALEFSSFVKSLYLFGFGVRPREYYLDSLFMMCSIFVSNIFYTWGLMECFLVVNRLTYSDDQIQIHKARLRNLLRSRQLSDKICHKVMDYYHYSMSKVVVIEKTNDLYQFLPSSLIKEIKLSSLMKYVRRIPYFAAWPRRMLEDLTMLLKEEVFLQHDIVSEAWLKGEGLVIVETGMLAVYTYNQEETGHLIDGDYFGELSLVTDREIRTSVVVAASRCKVLFLHKNDFRRYMRDHSRLFFGMREMLRQKYAAAADSVTAADEALQEQLVD